MPEREIKPILSSDEYLQALNQLLARLSGDSESTQLFYEIERILRFEFEKGISPSDRLISKLFLKSKIIGKRTALISDIHGSLEGLELVLADISNLNCDRIVCLGDIVDGGKGNEQVIEILNRIEVPCVRGNHDEFNDLVLSKQSRIFLTNLPEQIVDNKIILTHISPRISKRKIDNSVEAWNVFEETSAQLIFVGHTHIPFIFSKRSDNYGEAMRHNFEYNKPFEVAVDDRHIICVGSVAYGRDRIGKIRYAIYDSDLSTIEFRAIEGPLLDVDYSFH
jgi:putative phosphoesterase